MFTAPKIVARNYTEAHRFARETLGLLKGQYRVVTSPSSLMGMSGEVHLAPGWDKRPDRFAIRGKLKYSRLTVIDHEADEVKTEETPAEVPETIEETSNGDHMVDEGAPLFEVPENLLEDIREQLRISVEVTDDFTPAAEAVDEAVEEIEPEDKPAEEQDVEPEPETNDDDNGVKEDDSDKDVEDERPLNGRRRRRCKECGNLIHPDDVEDHARDHAADMVSLEQKAQENLR